MPSSAAVSCGRWASHCPCNDLILKAWRLLRTPSLREKKVTVFTVLLPVLPLSVWFNLSMIPMIWVLLIYATWCLVALLLMGSMAQEQRADVDQRISEKVDEVSGQVGSLEYKHDESAATIAGLQQQVDEVDEVMRKALEELGAALPGRRYYVQASVSSLSIMTAEATVQIRGGSRRARLRRWIQRKARRIWVIVVGEAT